MNRPSKNIRVALGLGALLGLGLIVAPTAEAAPRRNTPAAYRRPHVAPRSDFDRDGIQNRYDRDIDGDGIRNSRDRNDYSRGGWNHNRRDFDRDGIRNRRDRDRDNDGVRNRRDRFDRNPYRR